MKSPTRPDQLSPKLYFLIPGVSPQDPRSGEGELAAGLFSGILSSNRPPPHCTTHTGPPRTVIISFVPESIKIRSCRTNFKTGFFLSDYMWPPPTVWNSTHPQVHVHSLRLSPARLCSVGKISVWSIFVQFSQKIKKTKKMKFWLFHSSLNFWGHFFRKICIFSTNFHFVPNLTQTTQFSTVAQFTALRKAENSQPDSTLSSGQRN